MRSRNLDYTPLTRRVGLRARLRMVARDNMLVVGMTVSVLLLVGALTVFFVQVLRGEVGDFGWFCLGFLAPCGVWAVANGLLQAGKGGAVAAFARANDLELIRALAAKGYAGSLFADGSHVVRQSVRTRGEAFIEVGDRFSVSAPKVVQDGVTDTISVGAKVPQLFLRARLGGAAKPGAVEMITESLDDEMRELGGDYAIEMSGREITVFGTRELSPTKDDRMERAVALADRMVAIADSGVADDDVGEPATAPAGRRPMGALAVIGLVVALLVVGPLLVALVMSAIDGDLRGRDLAAQMVVGLVVVLLLAVVAALVRLVTTPRGAAGGRTSWLPSRRRDGSARRRP